MCDPDVVTPSVLPRKGHGELPEVFLADVKEPGWAAITAQINPAPVRVVFVYAAPDRNLRPFRLTLAVAVVHIEAVRRNAFPAQVLAVEIPVVQDIADMKEGPGILGHLLLRF
jgi:hypothetical protein